MKKFENPEMNVLVLVTEEVTALFDFLSAFTDLADIDGDGGWSADK